MCSTIKLKFQFNDIRNCYSFNINYPGLNTQSVSITKVYFQHVIKHEVHKCTIYSNCSIYVCIHITPT